MPHNTTYTTLYVLLIPSATASSSSSSSFTHTHTHSFLREMRRRRRRIKKKYSALSLRRAVNYLVVTCFCSTVAATAGSEKRERELLCSPSSVLYARHLLLTLSFSILFSIRDMTPRSTALAVHYLMEWRKRKKEREEGEQRWTLVTAVAAAAEKKHEKKKESSDTVCVMLHDSRVKKKCSREKTRITGTWKVREVNEWEIVL